MATQGTKRKHSALPESVHSLGSQDSLTDRIGGLGMSSQASDSTSEKPFKIPRRKEVPTGTIASEKLEYIEESFLPGYRMLDVKTENKTTSTKVHELSGDYIVDLAAMISSMAEVASCRQCKEGVMELFEIDRPGTCASKLLFRCSTCKYGKFFMNVGEIKSLTNRLDLSCVLGARLVGMNSENLRTFNACMNLPPAPTPYTFDKTHRLVLAAAEEEAEASMERAAMQLKSQNDIDPTTNSVLVPGSIDGAYNSSACFSSIVAMKTGKALAYKVAAIKCRTCTMYKNNAYIDIPSDKVRAKWDDHRKTCPLEYPEHAGDQMETAVAPDLIKQAFDRGIVFHTIVGDGDNNAIESLNKTFCDQLGIPKIKMLECLSHAMRTMMANLIKDQKAGPDEPQGEEIKNMTRSIAGRVTHLYRLALENNDGNPTEAKAEIDAIPSHLGANDDNAHLNHEFCPVGEHTWCDYQKAILNESDPPHHLNYLSVELVKYVNGIFSDFGYNREAFIQTVGFNMTTNHNEVIHSLLNDMAPKKDHVGYHALRLAAALSVIRYNEGYNAVYNIFKRLPTSNRFIRTKERFRELDNKRIKTSTKASPWKDTFPEEEIHKAERKEQISKFGVGYLHGNYSLAKSVIVELASDSDVQEDSQDDN